MENYQLLFPPLPSTSSHLQQSGFSSGELHTRQPASDDFRGSQLTGGLPAAAGVEEKCGSDEVKTAGKKARKPRYAFQTRCQVDILDDGYRWRKYGQKAVKNNRFPRSYYRCTHRGCNVKKQIQRLSEDEGVVVTTYEGTHDHPVDKSNDSFEHILSQMQICTNFY